MNKPQRKRSRVADPTQYPIETGIPIGQRANGARPLSQKTKFNRYGFQRLQIGECIFVPLADAGKNTAQGAAKFHAKRNNKDFVVILDEVDGVRGTRIWRTK